MKKELTRIENTNDRIGVDLLERGKSSTITVDCGRGIAFERTTDVWVKPGRAYGCDTHPWKSEGPYEFRSFVEVPHSTVTVIVTESWMENSSTVDEYSFTVEKIENGVKTVLFSEWVTSESDADVDETRNRFHECADHAVPSFFVSKCNFIECEFAGLSP